MIDSFPYQAIPRPYEIEIVPTYKDKPPTKVRIFSSYAVNYSTFREFEAAGIHCGTARCVGSSMGR